MQTDESTYCIPNGDTVVGLLIRHNPAIHSLEHVHFGCSAQGEEIDCLLHVPVCQCACTDGF